MTVADPDMPLIYVLRSRLGLMGTRLGCGLAQCGSCAVMIDGDVQMSCAISAQDVCGKSVTTIEGLHHNPVGRKVQQAFVAANAAQCGWCSSGIIVTLCALFTAEPSPSRQAVRDALSRHLCRCGAQPRVLAAAETLARTHFE